MTKPNTPSKHKFTFLYGNYVHGNGIFILAMDKDEIYSDVTVNLYPYRALEPDSNCVHIPDSIDPVLYEQIKEQLILAEIDTVSYGNFDSTAKLVRLKPDWKSHCKPLNV